MLSKKFIKKRNGGVNLGEHTENFHCISSVKIAYWHIGTDGLNTRTERTHTKECVKMSLSKKTYIAVAEVLRTARTKKDIITGLSNLFAMDNARFDPYRFREAINRKD